MAHRRWPAALVLKLAEEEHALIREVDRACAEATTRAGAAIICCRGCTECCIGAFDISAADALRLYRGLRRLRRAEPGAAEALEQRACAAWRRMAVSFPGRVERGILGDGEAAREVFCEQFAGAPCPALSPDDGACLLYRWRPLGCRVQGLPARYGSVEVPPCDLNFRHAPRETIAAAGVEVDPEDREARLLELLSGFEPQAGDTVVAAVLAGVWTAGCAAVQG